LKETDKYDRIRCI